MKLNGKCKSCLGCGLLEDKGFKGRKKCKYYIRANRYDILEIAMFVGITCLIVFILLKLGFAVYEKISMLAGG